MKKLLSIILALSFILCTTAVFAVSAAVAKFGDWTVKAGTATALDGGIASVSSDGMLTYNGNIYAGKVELKVGPTNLYNAANYEILFGGKGIKSSTGTTATAINDDSTVSAYRISYGYQNIYLDKTDGVANFARLETVSVSGKFSHQGNVTTTIEWTEEGAIKVSLNGTEVISVTGYAPFGGELAVRGSAASANLYSATVVPTASQVDTTFDDWTAIGNSVSEADGTVAALGETGAIVYNGSIYAGKVTIKSAMTNQYGAAHYSIVFGAKGIKSSAGTTGAEIRSDANVSGYRVIFEYNNMFLEKMEGGIFTRLGSGNVTTNDNATREITIAWTEEGAIRIWYQGTECASIAALGNVCVPYGGELAVLAHAQRTGRPTTVYSASIITTPEGGVAPNTGDNTAIYVVASAVVLAATFAVACISRKKRIAE